MQVISKLNEKTGANTFVSHPIGSAAEFIKPQRKSNNHNLEEQLIMGTDLEQTHTFTVSGDTVQETDVIKFNPNTSTTTDDYYVLEKQVTKNLSTYVDADNKKLILNLNPQVTSGTYTLKYIKHVDDPEDDNEVVLSTKTITRTVPSVGDSIVTTEVITTVPPSSSSPGTP